MSSQALGDWATAHQPQLGHLATHEEREEHDVHLNDHVSHGQHHEHELENYHMDLVDFDEAHHQYHNDLDSNRHTDMHMHSFDNVNDADLAELDSVFSMRHDQNGEFDPLPVSGHLMETSDIFYSPLINDLNDTHGTPLISPAMEPSREQAVSGEIMMPPSYLNSPISSKGTSPSSQPISAPRHPRTTEHTNSQRTRLQHNSQSPQSSNTQQHLDTSPNSESVGAITPAILMNLAPSKNSSQESLAIEHSMENKLQDALRAAVQMNEIDGMASANKDSRSTQQGGPTSRIGPARKSRSNQSTPVILAGNSKNSSRRRSSASLKSMSASSTPVLYARPSRGSNRSTPTVAPILPAHSVQQQQITLPSAIQSQLSYKPNSEELASDYIRHDSDSAPHSQNPSPQSLSATFMRQTSKSTIGEQNQLPYNLSYTQKIAEEANEKKASHKLAEQERRQRLNSAITELSRTVDPSTPMTSKAAAIEGAIAYIRKLQARIAELEDSSEQK